MGVRMIEVKLIKTVYQCETCNAQYDRPEQIGYINGQDVCENCIEKRQDIARKVREIIEKLH